MGKLDRRLVGDTYMVARALDLVEPPGIIIFNSPEVAKAVEESVRKSVEMEQAAGRAVSEAIDVLIKETAVEENDKS